MDLFFLLFFFLKRLLLEFLFFFSRLRLAAFHFLECFGGNDDDLVTLLKSKKPCMTLSAILLSTYNPTYGIQNYAMSIKPGSSKIKLYDNNNVTCI